MIRGMVCQQAASAETETHGLANEGSSPELAKAPRAL